ncbi:hypothetical protein BKI52_36580 [marine bacterium AO1-C]|nr:hypothetical protein BKI52_36580 [marine bacterium AO1-C]
MAIFIIMITFGVMLIFGITFFVVFKNIRNTTEQVTGNFTQTLKDGLANQARARRVSDKDVIDVAIANQGKVTATILVARLDISIDEATQKLEELHNKGIFTLENTTSGHLVYKLVDMDLM